MLSGTRRLTRLPQGILKEILDHHHELEALASRINSAKKTRISVPILYLLPSVATSRARLGEVEGGGATGMSRPGARQMHGWSVACSSMEAKSKHCVHCFFQPQGDSEHKMVKPREASGSNLIPEAKPRTQDHQLTMITHPVRTVLSSRNLEGNPMWNPGANLTS